MASSRNDRAASSLLGKAVSDFERNKVAQVARSSPRPVFLNSTPPQPVSQIHSHAIGTHQALQPTPASILNQRNSQTSAKQGVKRTSDGVAKSDGLAKFTSNSMKFEEDITSVKPAQMVQGTKSAPIEFDSDDFDSDVDLDLPVEAPKKLPSPSRLARPIVYPTLPRQQQMHSTYQETQSFDLPSSTALDWTSSPPEHLLPARKPAAVPIAEPQVQFQKASTLPPPAKRTIPWQTAPGEGLHRSTSLKVESTKDIHTPIKTSKSSATDFLNFSASTVKEQQKQHRQEAKAAADKKKSEAMITNLTVTTTKRKKVPRVFLSEEQEHVLNLVVKEKASTFFTGSAGTGKSVLLREIIAAFRRTHSKEPDRVAVTASTGLAACNIGGVTLHSFAGIGLGKEEVPELVKKIKRNQKAKQRWMRTRVLIVDEISMIDAELFDKLEQVARTIRNNGRPFGGIQLVITGDFFQLPPVPDRDRVARFCFDANQWKTTIAHTIGLHHVFRQKDPVFAGMLNEMREGRLSASSIAAFKKLDREVSFKDEIKATALFPTRKEVDQENTRRLSSLAGVSVVFEAKDGGEIKDKVQRDKLLANCMASETITLIKGAQVMLIKNIDDELVNGSIGTVIAFMTEGDFETHKLDAEIHDQVGNGADLPDLKAFAMTKEEKARIRLTENITTARRWPMVRFPLSTGTTRDLLCMPETWKIELPNGEVQAARQQVPLILAWALSIHKAQGQTLDRVTVDLGNVFEKGQAYVALSRATSMAGLQVKRFDASKVFAHERVRTFYSNLAKIEGKGVKLDSANGSKSAVKKE